ncbi:hypothetical protein Tsubulata_040488 [Turnera subulata]|uniref:MADS-box domain-containing protein n=1 Tax=Turnera subulata TaxID=218843 RepID=A0A9Q0F7S3_9ROSI|nr:hypothetical protein Tsubulata_040488 [Turnera subulata]
MAERQTKGKQKIDMKEIDSKDKKLITFSKRKSGIYKKAGELSTLTGVEVGVVIFSPAGKPFSFATSSIDCMANRFLGRHPPTSNDQVHPIVEAHRQLRIDDSNRQYNELLRSREVEKEKTKILKEKLKGKDYKGWWDVKTRELSKDKLVELENRFKNLHINMQKSLANKKNGEPNSLPAPPVDPNIDMDSDPFTCNPNREINHEKFSVADPKERENSWNE